MRPQHCKVFKADLTYMFYGRPAYRFKEDEALFDEYNWPVILVFRPEVESLGREVYPFDSGAFAGGLYADWLHSGWCLDDFALDPNKQSHARHVGAFYENNDAYLEGRAKHFTSGSLQFNLEAAAIGKMIREYKGAPADDRRLAVELVVNQDIPIDAAHLLAIVVPAQLSTSAELRAVERTGIAIFPYRLITSSTAREHHRLMEDKVYELLKGCKCA